MAKDQAQTIARLEAELASARSRCSFARLEAGAAQAQKDQAERDEALLSSILLDIAQATGFDQRQPVSHLPHHIRKVLGQRSAA